MSKLWSYIKQYIKRKRRLKLFLVSIYQYLFPKEDKYGYIRKKYQVKRLEKHLEKLSGGGVKARKAYDPKKENQFIFIGNPNPQNSVKTAVFGDIALENLDEKRDCSFYTTRVLQDKRKQKFHETYFYMNQWIPLPGKGYWERQYITKDIKFDTNKNIFVVFVPGLYCAATFSQPGLWERIIKISEQTFCKRIFYLLDPIDKYPEVQYWFSFFHMVAGCAYEDQNKYGIKFIDTPCVKYPLISEETCYDIYIRVWDSGRAELIQECYRYLKERGVSCCFYVSTKREGFASEEGLHFVSEGIPYVDMLREEMRANVLLEIVAPGVGSGATLRYYEAVIYGKKLLTNNPTVKELSFYDERFIHYFERVEDIDIDWIRDYEDVDYHYNGEFSTEEFCRKLENMEHMIEQATQYRW